jgi:hypothetical protein
MTGADGNGKVSKNASLLGGCKSESLTSEATVWARKGGLSAFPAKQVA